MGDSFVKDLATEFKRLHGGAMIEVKETSSGVVAPVVILPEGLTPHNIEEFVAPYRARPLRLEGESTLQDFDSFTAHVNRFKNENSAVFADYSRTAPTFVCVYDYNERPLPERDPTLAEAATNPAAPVTKLPPVPAMARHCGHRAKYAPRLSDEWVKWTKGAAGSYEGAAFAQFIEDNIADVLAVPADDENADKLTALLAAIAGTPSQLMALSRNVSINAAISVQSATTLASGEISLQYTEAHKDNEGRPITVPNLFFLAVPVFFGGAVYRIPVRLRYRLTTGKVAWSYSLYRADMVFDDAFRELVQRASEQTQLAVFVGTPE